MYIILFYNRYDDVVDCAIGPFETIEESRAWVKKNWSDKGTGIQQGYRKVMTHKLVMTFPEWVTD